MRAFIEQKGNDQMFGPLESLDDVRHTLGMWLLSQEEITPSQVKDMVTSARELSHYVECNLRLRDITEQGFAISYFSPDLRREIRVVLDEMDQISGGTETTLRRRNEALSEAQKAVTPMAVAKGVS